MYYRTGYGGPEGEWRYSSTLSSTSTLGGGGWLTQSPGRLTPGKGTRHPMCRRVGGPQGRSGWLRKISFSPGLDTPVASRCTDHAVPDHSVVEGRKAEFCSKFWGMLLALGGVLLEKLVVMRAVKSLPRVTEQQRLAPARHSSGMLPTPSDRVSRLHDINTCKPSGSCRYIPPALTLKNSTYSLPRAVLFRTVLRKHGPHIPKQHSPCDVSKRVFTVRYELNF